MKRQVRYGTKVATVLSADGAEGDLIRSVSGKYCFRVYHGDGEFTDYNLRHSDLCITIHDPLAAFYTIDGKHVLDHDPDTLGLEDLTEFPSREQA